jgi:hypothetical protein
VAQIQAGLAYPATFDAQSAAEIEAENFLTPGGTALSAGEEHAIPHNGNTATVYFTVTNKTNLNSFAHSEVTTGGILQSIDGAQPEIAFYSSMLGLDMYMYRPQYQTFQWQEPISY